MNNTQVRSSRTLSGPSHPTVSTLLKQSCLVNGWISATALVDSGAACCFISRSFVTRNNIEILEGGNYTITLADKSSASTNQMVMITLELCTIKFTMTAIVMDELASGDIILGINFLKVFNPTIDWNELTMSIDSSLYTAATTTDMSASDIILASFTLVVPSTSKLLSNEPVALNPCENIDLKKITCQQMKKLLKDRENVILCSIYMLPTSTNKVELHQVDVATKPKFNRYEQKIHDEYRDVFESLPKTLPPRREHDHAIEIVPGSQPPSKPAYRLSITELDELKKQLDTLLEHGFIRASRSPYGAPMLFVKKKDGSMRMCIDYRQLNSITIKNKYPLPRVDELLNRLGGAKYFTKIDLQSGYHQIRMKESDIEKTAFRTRYGSFEFLVLPFGLTNAPSTFMMMMQDILRPYLDKFVISYLDDILIYSNTLEEHQKHVRIVLDTLREHKLYVKLSKCEIFREQVEFLGYNINRNGLSMMEEKVKAIQQWPTPKSVKQVRSFLGLAGFYRQFIKMFSATTSPLTALLQKESPFHWTDEHQRAFDTIKQHIATQPTLILPQEDIQFVVHTDASAFAVGASINQDHGSGLQPIAFLSKKLLPAETRYATHEQELLAIIIALKTWRHFLYGRKFIIQTDHHSLVHFMKQPNMSNRQARWSELLSQYDFEIQYVPGNTNVVADALSRRADHEPIQVETSALNQVTTVVTVDSSSDNLLQRIKQAYQHDEDCKQILIDHESKENTSSEWQVTSTGLIKRHQQVLVPNDTCIRTEIITSNHDDITAAHRGVTKTIELVTRTFYWKHMHRDVKEYVNTCINCQQNKITNQPPLGLLHPIETPEQRWHTVTMDLITSLPVTKNGHDAIVVFVDKMSKMVHYVPTVTTIDAPSLATLMINHVIKLHGIPICIISDRDPRFTSSFWKALWLQLGTKLKMSTAYHPQTDGLTERNNRTLEESLRSYVNYHQNNWDNMLPLLEFSYNNCINSTTGFSPFFLNYGQHPMTPLDYVVRKEVQINDTAAIMIDKLYDSLTIAHDNITKAQASQKKYADIHRRDFEQFKIGDQVLLSTDNLRTPGRAPKLIAKRIGPFTIIRVLGKLNYELELPLSMKGIHNRFHVQQLTRFHSTDAFPSRPITNIRPPAVVVAGHSDNVYEVQSVLKHRGTGNRLQYLIHWKGYPEYESTWEPVSAFVHHRDKIDEYHRQLQSNNTFSNTNPSSKSNPINRIRTRSQK